MATTIEDVKNQVAKNHGYINWENLQRDYCRIPINEILHDIIQGCCDEQIKACFLNAESFFRDKGQYFDKDSILNTPNIALTKAKA